MRDRRIDLDRARREAKALLRAARAGDARALARMRDDRAPCLADAQAAVARGLGAASWPALVRRVEAADAAGRALLAAARVGDADEVYALLEDGAPPDARERVDGGATALHVAAAAGHVDVLDVLVGWVPVDRDARDTAGRTALDVCADDVCAAILRSVGVAAAGQAAPARELGDEHAEEAWAADAAWLTHVATTPGAAARRVGDGLAVLTGEPDNTRNGVVCSWLAPEEADATIAELLAWFAAAGAPARWLVGATTEPPDLGERLARAGCRPERGAVHMAARLEDLDLTPREAPAGLELAVATAGELRRHTAALDGRTVGEATVLHAAPGLVAGIDLEVTRGARRRGVGRALVLAALRAARADGATLAVLAPTPATVPFHEALGFTLERSAPDRCFFLPPPQI